LGYIFGYNLGYIWGYIWGYILGDFWAKSSGHPVSSIKIFHPFHASAQDKRIQKKLEKTSKNFGLING
jgi:hypothetical protein